MIEIRFLSGDAYQVRIKGRSGTAHQITLPESERLRLGGGEVSAEKLIEESFRFLLEREPNTSILPSFELSQIGHYFPEYEGVIRERLTGK